MGLTGRRVTRTSTSPSAGSGMSISVRCMVILSSEAPSKVGISSAFCLVMLSCNVQAAEHELDIRHAVQGYRQVLAT